MPSLRQWDGTQWLDVGVQALNDLTDADTATTPPAPGDGLSWNGTNWVPAAPAAGTVLPAAGAGLTGGAASYDVGAGTGITVAADAVALDTAFTDGRYVQLPLPPAPTIPAAGAGLAGGVTSYDVGAGTGITVAADTVALDEAYTDTLYADIAHNHDAAYAPIVHAHTVDSLTDADTSTVAPAVGDGLQWNGTNWVPAAPAAGAVLPVAGAGLTGGTASYEVGAGAGIAVAADAVALDTAFTDARYVQLPLPPPPVIPAAGAGLAGGVTAYDVGAGAGITVAADTVALDTVFTDARYVLAPLPAPPTIPAAGAGLTGGAASYEVGAGAGITVAADTVALDTAYTDTLYSPVTHTHPAIEEVVVSGTAPTDPAADLWMDTAAPDPTVELEERVRVLEDMVASLMGGAS